MLDKKQMTIYSILKQKKSHKSKGLVKFNVQIKTKIFQRHAILNVFVPESNLHFVCPTLLLYSTVNRSDITNFKLLKVVNIYLLKAGHFMASCL